MVERDGDQQLVMAELKAPAGAFLVLELEADITSSQVTALFRITTRLLGVRSCSDLACWPVEYLQERVLLRLSPDEQRTWRRATK